MLPDLSTANTIAAGWSSAAGSDTTGSTDSSAEPRYPPRANERSPPSTISPRPRSFTAATSALQKRGLASAMATSSSTTAW